VSRRSLPAVLLVALVVLAVVWGCGDSATRPPGEKQVIVRTDSFFEKDVEITAGKTVRWVNVLRRSEENVRTVTSGTGPDDPKAGDLFDATLQGFASGEAEGDDFVFRFTEPGVYHYFSRYPVGHEFSGTVTAW
jgi:plastocyanin